MASLSSSQRASSSLFSVSMVMVLVTCVGLPAASTVLAVMVRRLAQLIEPQSANKVVRRALIDRFGLGFPNGHHFEDILFHSQVLAAAQRIGQYEHLGFEGLQFHGAGSAFNPAPAAAAAPRPAR